MNEDKIFIDTNILVYAHDISAEEKHGIAKKIILDLWESKCGVISTQVLQEFFVCMTKKINRPLNAGTAKEIIIELLKWEVVVNEGVEILKAIEINQKYKYSFWDSMIINAAISGGANLLLSEDMHDGQEIENVKIENPFNYN